MYVHLYIVYIIFKMIQKKMEKIIEVDGIADGG